MDAFNYSDGNKVILGKSLSDKVVKKVFDVLNNIDKCGHHKFINTTTLGFAGSCIAEVTNIGIKKGANRSVATMNLDRAGFNQLRQISQFTHKRDIATARELSRNKLWSKSETKNALTAYAEGVACSNHDIDVDYVLVSQIRFCNYACWCCAAGVAVCCFNDCHSPH